MHEDSDAHVREAVTKKNNLITILVKYSVILSEEKTIDRETKHK